MILKELLRVIASGELVDIFIDDKRFVAHPRDLEKNLLDDYILNHEVLLFYVNDSIIYVILK